MHRAKLSFVLLVMLVVCLSIQGCGSNPVTPADSGLSCSEDKDCQEGYRCEDSSCVEKPLCTDFDGDSFCDKREGFEDCNDNRDDIHPDATEVCDGLDNDCDGQVDEVCPCRDGDEQPCGSNVGVCKKGKQVCKNGQWDANCVGGIRPEDHEVCDDELDNNCDGSVNEDCSCHPGTSRNCGLTLGICTAGVQTCEQVEEDWIWSACSGGTPPADEVCEDGLDNDCDGAIDNGCDCVEKSRHCGVNQGTCHAGMQQCTNGIWGQCENAGFPEDERCDGLDNDCDDLTDEIGCECTINTPPTVCGKNAGECQFGTKICNNGFWGPCEEGIGPTQEICDGRDNDCDGLYDEDFHNLLHPCNKGQGICLRTGAWICSQDGSQLECNAPLVEEGTQEFCNGLDDDCDGQTDEGFEGLGSACAVGLGECYTEGVTTCDILGIEIICNAALKQPSRELCDSLDNDCDGQTDEDFIMLGQPCGTGIGACYNEGAWVCRADGTAYCNAVATPPSEEICDGLDNDCDGQVDKPWSAACSTACGTGYRFCESAQEGPCHAPQPSPEVCDYQDNDCNGQTDEGFDVGSECQAGQGMCASLGYTICSPEGDGTICNAKPGTPQTEEPYLGSCDDGVDNDCDGQTDCADDNCKGNEASYCSDLLDNDCDGQTDGQDSECGCKDTGMQDMMGVNFLALGLGMVILTRRKKQKGPKSQQNPKAEV